MGSTMIIAVILFILPQKSVIRLLSVDPSSHTGYVVRILHTRLVNLLPAIVAL